MLGGEKQMVKKVKGLLFKDRSLARKLRLTAVARPGSRNAWEGLRGQALRLEAFAADWFAIAIARSVPKKNQNLKIRKINF